VGSEQVSIAVLQRLRDKLITDHSSSITRHSSPFLHPSLARRNFNEGGFPSFPFSDIFRAPILKWGS
jgi:hypothetical protein